MIARLLAYPLIDILLLIILIRLFFPKLFSLGTLKKEVRQKERIIIRESAEPNQFKKEDGEYIDYEEIR